MIRPWRRDGRHVALHHADAEPEAMLWAIACRSVLRELGIAGWWRVQVDEAGDGGWLVSVDYQPAARIRRAD